MSKPERRSRRPDPDHRWLEAIIETGVVCGMIPEDLDAFKRQFDDPWKIRFPLACVARSIAQRERSRGPGTYEMRARAEGFWLCRIEIRADGHAFVTYPNRLTIGFKPGDLHDDEDN